tara:strand:+ start:2162 stop:2680 length:519 start_codon:yes stop_codon:yes gene_type:complete
MKKKMLTFKDMMTVEYLPGEDELVNYRAYRRKRTIGVGEGGPVGESMVQQLASEEVEVDEALSVQARLKRGRSARRNRGKLALGRRRAARRFATMEVLQRRARKAARKIFYNRIIKNIPRDKLSPQRKQEIEKRLETPAFQNRIARLGKKMIKDVRKKEMERRQTSSDKDSK